MNSNKKKILVVEDERIIALEIRDRLEDLDFHVTETVKSKEAAIESVKSNPPDLVLMDIMLGNDMAGLDAAEYIHEHYDIPVVFLTAYSDKSTLARAKRAEPYGYILKPLDEREVISTIEISLYKYEMEKKLKANEEWLSTTLKCIGDAVITTDMKGSIVSINPTAEKLTGWSQKEATGQDINNVFQITKDNSKKGADNPVGIVLNTGGPVSLTHNNTVLITKKGKKIPIDNSAAPIRDDRGNLNGVVLVFRNIAEKKQMEEQLRQASKMEAIGTLAGGVAHDFNNILTAIRGRTDLILPDLGKKHPHYQSIQEIQDSVDQAADLTRRLLLFSCNRPMSFKILDLNALIENMTKMIRRLMGEHIQVNTDLLPELSSIRADKDTLEQILLNLSINARDSMPEGGTLTIETEHVTISESQSILSPEARPGHFVCLSITDTGVGMNKKIQEHIFEPFFTTKKQGEGAGLGLAVVFGIVKEHDGWIEVKSKRTMGTTFNVYFQAVSENPDIDIQHDVPFKSLKGNGERILYVEDETKVRTFMEKALTRSNFVTFSTANAKEAMEVFEKENGNFDLVFSDVELPGVSGVELVEKLLTKKPDVHILLTSGCPEYSSKWSAIQEKAYPFLEKPYNLFTLLQKIRTAMNNDNMNDSA
jgi:two-component system cell cycle sensor histidine kinase/response regulator CckA